MSVRCTNILVSASSCFTGGGRVDTDADWCTLDIGYNCNRTTHPFKNAGKSHNCCLLCEFLRKSFQLSGQCIFTPVPHFCLVWSFKLYFTYLSQNNIKTGSINCCDLFGEMRSKRVRIVLVKCFKFFVLLMSAALSVIKPPHVTRLLAVVSALSGTVSNSSDQTTTCDTVACCGVSIVWHSFQQ